MIRFEGFGLNFATGMLVFLVAALLAGLLVIAGPGQTEAKVVSPCKPYAWQERGVTWKYNGPLTEVWVTARLRYNGCEVAVAPDSQDCWWRGAVYAVDISYCKSSRVNLQTAYGQNVVVMARFQISLFWSGFPIGTAAISCHRYDRRGVLIGQSYGPYARPC